MRWFILRYLWATPATLLGVAAIVAGCRRARVRVVDGVVEAHGPAIAWGLRHLTFIEHGAAALTLGHVVLGVDATSLEWTRAHERVHVRQYEAWGPLFLPAYVAFSIWARVRGKHFYFDNPFEVEAFSADASEAAGGTRTTHHR
ncbi:MAG: hypothetical protein ABMA15_16840 [Vicinamibacterales bacterium]